MPPTVRLTANAFGPQRAGIMYGWITAAHQLGAAAAAGAAGLIRTDLGSYLAAFVLSGLLCLAATVMVLFIGHTDSGTRRVVPAAA